MSWQTIRFSTACCLRLVAGVYCLGNASFVLADRIVTKSGETFQGTVVEQTADTVVFDSLAAGRVTIPRSAIDVLEQTQLPGPTAPGLEPAAPPPTTAAADQPAELVPAFDFEEAKFLSEVGEPLAKLNPMKGWKSRFSLGYTARRGQESDNRLEIRFRSEKKTEKKEYMLDSSYDLASTISEDDVKTRTDQRANVKYEYRYYFSKGWFLQSNTRYYRNLIEELRHEATQTLGTGYRWRGRSWTVRVAVGVGPRVRNVGGDWSSQLVGGVTQDFEWHLTRTLSLRQSFDYYVAPDELTDSSRRSWIELNQKVTSVWSLGFRYEYTYDSVVGASAPNEQQRWSLNLGLEF